MNRVRIFLGFLTLVALAGCTSLPLPDKAFPSDGTIRVMSWNIHYAVAGDDTWEPEAHGTAVAQFIDGLSPSIVGLQEVISLIDGDYDPERPLLAALKAGLGDRYEILSPRGPAQAQGMNPIIYDHSRLTPLASGVLWLNDSPLVPDSGFTEQSLPRMASWAVFYDHHGSSPFGVINTHWDHVEWVQHNRASIQIIELYRSILQVLGRDDLPFVVMGDFNEIPSAASRQRLAEEFGEVDEHRRVSFPLFLGMGFPIDGIYATGPVDLRDYRVLDPQGVSDHRALIAVVEYNPQ